MQPGLILLSLPTIPSKMTIKLLISLLVFLLFKISGKCLDHMFPSLLTELKANLLLRKHLTMVSFIMGNGNSFILMAWELCSLIMAQSMKGSLMKQNLISRGDLSIKMGYIFRENTEVVTLMVKAKL